MACKTNDSAILPAVLSIIAFILALAGWWLAWISGLIAMIFCIISVCVDLPRGFSLATAILAAIAALGELFVALQLVDTSVVCTGNNCFANQLGLTIIAVVALVLWAAVAVLSWRAS